MKTPKLKKEIFISISNDDPKWRGLFIHVATERARMWVEENSGQFTSDHRCTYGFSNDAPCSTILTVSPCFDFMEVKRYLSKPPFLSAPNRAKEFYLHLVSLLQRQKA